MKDMRETLAATDLRVEDDVDQQLGVARMRRAVLDVPRRFHVNHHPRLRVRHLRGGRKSHTIVRGVLQHPLNLPLL